QWTEQLTLNGVRVMVLREDLNAARALLDELDPPKPAIARGPTAGGSSLLLLLTFLASLFIGWPIAGFRRPDLFHRVSAAALTLVTILVLLLEYWGQRTD